MTYRSGYRIKITDRLGSLLDRCTHTYDSPHDAERAAIRLARKHYGNTGRAQFNWLYNGLVCES